LHGLDHPLPGEVAEFDRHGHTSFSAHPNLPGLEQSTTPRGVKAPVHESPQRKQGPSAPLIRPILKRRQLSSLALRASGDPLAEQAVYY
jgi:hypothetical protein